MSEQPKIEQLIAMAERLIVALEGDIAALKAGTPAQMRSMDPEIQRLTAIYGREAQSFDIKLAQAAPAPLRARFLAITGIDASAIRRAAAEPGFLAGVLQFILAHEPTLMRFAEETGTPPAAVGQALRALPAGDDSHERSI